MLKLQLPTSINQLSLHMVKPKKHLGQHFLNDETIAKRIADSLTLETCKETLEIGPGTGVLTKYLIENQEVDLKVVDIDTESIEYLEKNFEELEGRIISGDFLHLRMDTFFSGSFNVIGNFPYNISSQIFFRVLDFRNVIPQVVCMLQKEVAQRIASPPGNKTYGILSVFMQAFYDVEYLFTVDEHVFIPPPRVKSGVIHCIRNNRETLDCDEKLFFRVVKQGFNNRRKTLRNALKPLNLPESIRELDVLNKRAEQLSVEDFESLVQKIEKII